MMAYEAGHVLGTKLCAILGISPDNVTRLEIIVDVNSAAQVRIHRLLKQAECRQIEDLLAQSERPQVVEVKGPGHG
jgi:hypothetical protein